MAFWIKLTYERNIYVIDLDRVATFCQRSNGRLAFKLPDADDYVIITQSVDPVSYQIIVDYVHKMTGFQLPTQD